MSGFLVVAYLIAGVLFIRSLGGLSKQETARQANTFGMIGMPELVAMLHSFVGLAAVLVGFSSYLHPLEAPKTDVHHLVHLIEIWVGIAVGAITLTGSIIAWGKLKGSISGKPLLLPGRH